MAKRVVEADWQRLEVPKVDAALCTSCGLCPEVCPTECLEMGPHLPKLARPRDCVSCGACLAVCPVGALTWSAPDLG